MKENKPNLSIPMVSNWVGKPTKILYRVRHSKKPANQGLCEWCHEKKKLEISFDHTLGFHTTNPKDYLWLCRSCHTKRDAEIRNKIIQNESNIL